MGLRNFQGKGVGFGAGAGCGFGVGWGFGGAPIGFLGMGAGGGCGVGVGLGWGFGAAVGAEYIQTQPEWASSKSGESTGPIQGALKRMQEALPGSNQASSQE
mmetsp:Transcript_22243/g.56982  ORF Transcript_22243/g.56982 Transcript_22243/m.56982 type:complete len:102 (+) Transcript_22243:401-706(+)|eukprot:jgi/Tetstr1/457284/TSEL_043889.t1